MDRIWWTRMPNAIAYINAVSSAVANDKCVALEIGSGFPWYNTMKEEAVSAIRGISSKRQIDELADNISLEPGQVIMDMYCTEEMKTRFRPSAGHAKFLAECRDTILNSRIVWIRKSSRERFSAWAEFVGKYNSNLLPVCQGALFILEGEEVSDAAGVKNVKAVTFHDNISGFDSYIFSMLMAGTLKESNVMRQYVAELADAVNGSDVERCAECLNPAHYRDFLRDTYNTLCSIVERNRRDNGQAFDENFDVRSIEKAIWNTQIRMVLPAIEEFRSSLVSKYQSSLAKLVKGNRLNNQLGETYDSPEDVEIGVLYFAASDRRINISDDEYKKLSMHRTVRNKLAHREVLSLDEVRRILD